MTQFVILIHPNTRIKKWCAILKNIADVSLKIKNDKEVKNITNFRLALDYFFLLYDGDIC
jgi:hypothetical protein